MSVIVAKRKQSRLEYVSTSSDLLKYTIQKCLKLPKRLTFFITTKIVDTAHDIYKNVLYIEKLYYSKELEIRKTKINETIAILEYLGSTLDILMIYAQAQFTEKQWEKWVGLINKEIALLKGIK